MRVEHGPGYEIHHLPLPSGHYARVRLYTNYVPVGLEIDELYGTNIHDLEALALALLTLARELKFPEGICHGRSC